MVNKEILGGLKSALERGQSLKQAMMSLYNAGYIKQEIEEAARALQLEQQQQQIQIQMPIQKPQIKIPIAKQIPIQKLQVSKQEIPIEKISQPVIQRVSNYADKMGIRNIMIIVLIIVLVLLLGTLGGIFFFRQELLALFGKLFS